MFLMSEHFDVISGSVVYPSGNPKNLPFDKFKCKTCGFMFSERMYGLFPSDHNPFDAANRKAMEHLIEKHLDRKDIV